MKRVLCIVSTACLYCSNFSEHSNYILRSETMDFSSNELRKSEILHTQKDNIKSSQISSFDKHGVKFTTQTSVQDGRTRLEYYNGALYSITTSDPETNCETSRLIETDATIENLNCNGHPVRNISVDKTKTYERHCEMKDGVHICHSKSIGSADYLNYEYFEYNYKVGPNTIYSMPISPAEKMHSYFMYAPSDIVNGKQVTTYKIEVPAGAPLPNLNSSGWEIYGTQIQTGYIASIGRYSLLIETNKYRSHKSTIETF